MLLYATYRNFWLLSLRTTAVRHVAFVYVYYDAVCVNAAVEINVLDYNFAVRRRTSTYAV